MVLCIPESIVLFPALMKHYVYLPRAAIQRLSTMERKMPSSFQEGLPLYMVKQPKGGDYAEESVQSNLNNIEVTLGREENIKQ